MKDVGLFLFAGRKAETVEARISEGAIVVASLVAGKGGNCFDANAEKIVSESLEERKCFGNKFAVLRQKFGVADFGEKGVFLFHGKSRQIIFLFGVDASDIFFHSVGERGLGKKFRPGRGVHSGEEAVFTEGFFVEKSSGAKICVEFLVVGFVEALGVNTNILN